MELQKNIDSQILKNRAFARVFRIVFLIVFFLVSSFGLSHSVYAEKSYFNNSQPSAFDQQPEFLPVHEAYQVDVEVLPEKILLHWIIADDYFLYGDKFNIDFKDEDNKHLSVEPILEEGITGYDEYFEKYVVKFYRSTLVTLPVSSLLKEFTENKKTLVLSAGYQGCADAGLCYPPETLSYSIDFKNLKAELAEDISVADEPLPVTADNVKLKVKTTSDLSFVMVLVFALLGGLILNLMPCVFPVLSIKVLSFASSSSTPSRLKMHGWFYTLGILVSFIAFAILLLALRNAGHTLGWGFQLQSPVFISFLVYLFFVLAASLSGAIVLGGGMMGVGHKLSTGNDFKSSFFTGVLAVVVASPCSAPFMGVALGYTLILPPAQALLIFVALGLGLASPFLLLSYMPKLIALMPKPGHWMERIKEFLAFPLYLSAVWLLWVLGHQAGSDAAALIVMGCVFIAFCFWLVQEKKSVLRLLLAGASLLLALSFPLSDFFSQQTLLKQTESVSGAQKENDSVWGSYTPEKLQSLLSAEKPVFVELTADWCITCLANEKMALSKPSVLQAMKDKNIHYLKGDWTNRDSNITELLNRYDRAGVPLYLLFSGRKNEPAKIFPQLLTEGAVLDAFEFVESK